MVSLIPTQVRKLIYDGFKGRLLTGTLRRASEGTGLDSKGDPTGVTYSTSSIEGIVDTYNAFYKAQAGIPDSDVRIVVIGGSLSVTPQKDDQIKFRDKWYQVREVSTDPALAHYELQSFEIEDPTA